MDWLWYSSSSEYPVYLDGSRYRKIAFDGGWTPAPEWVCQAPDGGLHVDARIGRIDMDVLVRPPDEIDLNWNFEYQVYILSKKWINLFRDRLVAEGIATGQLRYSGRVLDDWVTIHQDHAPPLRSPNVAVKICPVCGNISTWPRGAPFFRDSEADAREIIANRSGVFVSADLVRRRNIATPAGSHVPMMISALRDDEPLHLKCTPERPEKFD
jgi:hypothetical protein